MDRVDQGLQVQITDNSLARDLFSGDYNCLGDNENRPVKWMSVEALVNKCFSPASDVVSARPRCLAGTVAGWLVVTVSWLVGWLVVEEFCQ